MDKLLLVIFCVLALYAWTRYRVDSIRERQASCYHEWKELEVPDPAFTPGPFTPTRNIRVRNCIKCKKQELWYPELKQWK